jgi:mRNA turnover protein 4
MGRSRRQKVVALTAIRKRVVGRDGKQTLLNDIRTLVDNFENIYIFTTENMRNVKLKELRASWKDSRFYFGRKRIAQVAFGRTKDTEHTDGLHELSKRLVGNVGLLFTNRADSEVRRFFEEYAEPDFARSGFVATEAVQIDAGPLETFEASQETQLRSLGLDVTLVRGVVTLRHPFSMCDASDVLTPERAKLLEYLGIRMALFRLVLLCHYNKTAGFQALVDAEDLEELDEELEE